MLIILRWFKTEQRKPESILPAGLAVATAAIAAGLGEDRRNLIGKINRRNAFEMVDLHSDRAIRSIGGPRENRGGAVPKGHQETIRIHLHDVRRLDVVFHRARFIP